MSLARLSKLSVSTSRVSLAVRASSTRLNLPAHSQTATPGAILYQIGYSGLILLVEILIADTTSLRNRLLFSYIPATPFIINTWVSGNIIDDMVGTDTSNWRWGIGAS